MTARTAVGIAVCALASFRLAGASDLWTITFEDRLAAQTAIEKVYDSHRIWPKDNPQPKPPLSAVLPEAAIRAKVERYLEESNALDRIWRRPITASALQAELDRMVRDSHDPAMLRELFAALGNDPALIAETLARPSLSARLIRTWYASDDRFDGELKRRAEAALAACGNAGCMKSMGGRFVETTFRPREDRPVPADGADGRIAWLDPDAWATTLDRSTRPAMTLGALEEAADAFSVGAVLSRSDRKLTTASVVWDKPSFDVWFEGERRKLGGAIAVPAGTYALAAPAVDACTVDTWSSTPAGIEPRMDLTAVWTGAEMIVWGGVQSSGSSSEMVNSGGRYNPATDSWVPTSRGANAPSARYGHTAVWTGTTMIVWGGNTNGGEGSTGGRYDPSTDSWLPTSTGPNVPQARTRHTSVWTGSTLIVWGGYNSTAGGAYLNSGGRYDPASDSWQPTSVGANVPFGRTGHTAVWTGSVMVVWGGTVSGSFPLGSGGRYDPATDSWLATSTGANVPSARSHHTAIWTGTMMIVWGGDSSQSGEYQTGGRYDPASNSWLPTAVTASTASARGSHTAVWSGSEMIVWGGYNGSYLNSGARYNPSADSWTSTSSGANVPTARLRHAAVWTGTEMIVWGGTAASFVMLNTGGRYAPSTNTWVPTSITSNGAPAGRMQHEAVWTGAEMIVWGGVANSGALNSGGRYQPATNSWVLTSTGAHVPTGRSGHTALWTGSEMIVWGGYDGSYVNTGARYNPSQDKWTASAVGGPTDLAVGVWSGTEMLVWGGAAGAGGRYNPSSNSWASMSTVGAPTGRTNFSSVWTGSEMIVWGGGLSSDGGRYNPSSNSWLPTNAGANVPSGRYDHTAVWTGSEMIVWGGHDCCTYYVNSGGRYDPVADAWLPTSISANTPSGRTYHTAIWSGAEMVVWGGIPFTNGGRYRPSSDSWQPTTAVNAPSARSLHTAVWTGTEMIVWGGGNGGDIKLDSGGRYCADTCVSPVTLYRDADGDGHGDPGLSQATCANPQGWMPIGDDCDDTRSAVHPGAAEICDLLDDDCDGLVDEDASGVDTDGDGVHNACDICPAASDPAQSDSDHDGQGDLCDLDDGILYVLAGDPTHIDWQGESGPATWNIYEGDLAVLRTSGVYTQAPGSNALANRRCGVAALSVADTLAVPAGAVKFSLVTGVTSGVEGSLGVDGQNVMRPNTNPCP